MVERYIEFKTIYNTTHSQEIKSRDMEVALPLNCVGYRFYDREVDTSDRMITRGNPINVTPWRYKGEKISLDKLEEFEKDPVYAPHIGDIRFCYGAVLTKSGHVFPLKKGDEVFA